MGTTPFLPFSMAYTRFPQKEFEDMDDALACSFLSLDFRKI
jgi:hypothetical protein